MGHSLVAIHFRLLNPLLAGGFRIRDRLAGAAHRRAAADNNTEERCISGELSEWVGVRGCHGWVQMVGQVWVCGCELDGAARPLALFQPLSLQLQAGAPRQAIGASAAVLTRRVKLYFATMGPAADLRIAG